MKREKFLPYFKPSIGEEEIAAVVSTLCSGWLTTGEKTHLFEKALADSIGVSAALALNSCTAALHLALILLKVKTGDEIITTPFTFAATANVIEYLGAKPIFVDIEQDTLNINADLIENLISEKTKAFIIVHYSGHACNMDKIMVLSKKHQIPVIEDVAHGLGGAIKGKKLGSFGEFGAFSFYANKNITTMEGGMLVGNVDSIQQARIMSLHGINRDAWKRYRQDGDWFYEVIYPGLKYNMTDISASIGLQQLNKLDRFQSRRKQIAEYYNQELSQLPALQIPITKEGIEHAWFHYCLRLNLKKLSISRDQFISYLKDLNVGTTVHFTPLHYQPYYKNKYGYSPYDFPITSQEYQRILSLPLYPAMTDDDVSYVVSSVKQLVQQYAVSRK